MNVPTISMERREARRCAAEYLRAVRARPNADDKACLAMYRQLCRGRSILDLRDAFAATGADELGRPRLAIARACERAIVYQHYHDGGMFFAPRVGKFGKERSLVELPRGLLPAMKTWEVTALVPRIPPRFRPAGDLWHYWILWEAEWRPLAPRDPFLLQRIDRWRFAILAQWDLTEVERMVLRDRADV